ncbi:unnamed protein product, partial [Ectocarpus sp. 8 AP-2014]
FESTRRTIVVELTSLFSATETSPLNYLSIDFVPFFAWSCVVSCWRNTTSRQGYKGLFAPLLSPSVWERKGNIPAVTRLLQAYLSKNAVAVVEWGSLAGVLGTFQKLLSTRANEAYAFQLLGTIIVNVSVYV